MTTSWYSDARGRMTPLGLLHGTGFLRALEIRVTGSHPRPYQRPAAAAERTMSRRSAAGSRRTRRYGLRPAGPSGRIVDWPFNLIRTVKA